MTETLSLNLLAAGTVLILGILFLWFFRSVRYKGTDVMLDSFRALSDKIKSASTVTEVKMLNTSIRDFYDEFCILNDQRAVERWKLLLTYQHEREAQLRAASRKVGMKLLGVVVFSLALTISSCASSHYWAGGPCENNKGIVGIRSSISAR